ncbi:hypothetical protein KA005_75090, partial [bacterium]|nr:hypothetical protein [bacterium]
WSLPLITFTIFYIPVGLHVVGNWFEYKFPINKHKAIASKERGGWWFSILLLVGICVCLPKLLRPIRIEKQGYRDAVAWLSENTVKEDIIAVSDRRISFYAERKRDSHKNFSPKVCYIVKKIGSENEEDNFGVAVHKETVIWIDEQKKKKGFVIYKVL